MQNVRKRIMVFSLWTCLTILGIAAYMQTGIVYAAADVPINDENFPDEVFRTHVEIYDANHDGSLSETELQAVTEMDIYEKGINKLNGIEYFTSLKSLDCSSNQLSSLDMSQNLEIEELDCSSNQLSSLDVSDCMALRTLICTYNQLNNLDLSNCVALIQLNCFDNQLSSLDLSNCTALTGLNCYFNQLSNLDISQNTTLEQLDCSGNQLNNFDVSNCMALERLDCFDNQLSSLDVSQTTQLTHLYCYSNQLSNLDISQNTALEWLDCSGNQLSNFDVSNCMALEGLGCSDNQLSSLDVSHNLALTRLSCSNNQLSSLDISYNLALKSLSCDNNQLSSLDVSQNRVLTSLSCSGNRLDNLDISQHEELEYLYCASNQLSRLDVGQNPRLRWLYCENNQLSSLDVSNNTVLDHLNCSNNQLSSLDVSNCEELEVLDCSNNRLSYLDTSENIRLTDLIYMPQNAIQQKLVQIIMGPQFLTKTMGDEAFSLGIKLTKGDGKLTYTSNNPKVATVSDDGTVMLKGVGITNIIIRAEETDIYAAAEKVIKLTVNQKVNQEKASFIKVSSIKLSAPSNKIAAGKKVKLTAKISPANAADKKLKWKSSNMKVAKVDQNGNVTLLKKTGGKSVNITAIATDGSGKKATYKIMSMKGVVKKISIIGNKTIKAGKTIKLKAKVTASKGANKKVAWSSNNPKYAKVSTSGKVTALRTGKGKKVKITCKSLDGSNKKQTVTIKIK